MRLLQPAAPLLLLALAPFTCGAPQLEDPAPFLLGTALCWDPATPGDWDAPGVVVQWVGRSETGYAMFYLGMASHDSRHFRWECCGRRFLRARPKRITAIGCRLVG